MTSTECDTIADSWVQCITSFVASSETTLTSTLHSFDAWWLDTPSLKPRYPQVLINTNQCQFSRGIRCPTEFRGNKFKLGGRKE
jgi:hypothetical protein